MNSCFILAELQQYTQSVNIYGCEYCPLFCFRSYTGSTPNTQTSKQRPYRNLFLLTLASSSFAVATIDSCYFFFASVLSLCNEITFLFSDGFFNCAHLLTLAEQKIYTRKDLSSSNWQCIQFWGRNAINFIIISTNIILAKLKFLNYWIFQKNSMLNGTVNSWIFLSVYIIHLQSKIEQKKYICPSFKSHRSTWVWMFFGDLLPILCSRQFIMSVSLNSIAGVYISVVEVEIDFVAR